MKIRNLAITLLTIALLLGPYQSGLAHTPEQCDDVRSDPELPKCENQLANLCLEINSAGPPLKERDRTRLDGKFHMVVAKLKESKIFDADKKLSNIHDKVSTLRDLALANPQKAKIDVDDADDIIIAVEAASSCVLRP